MFKGWFRWKGVLLGCLVFVWMFLFIIAASFIFSGGASKQQWVKTYGKEIYDDYASSIQQTRDGGYIIAGVTKLLIMVGGDVWILKLDASGNVQWAKTYEGTDYDKANSIQQTGDGGYIVAGVTWTFGAGRSDVWVLKLDTNGNVQWAKTYGGTGYDRAYSIQQTNDGGYIVVGETSSFGAGDSDAWVLKLDANGNIQWQKTYGGTDLDSAYSIQQTKDGGYIIAGETGSFGAGNFDIWVLKLDTNGNVQWAKTYGGKGLDSTNFIQQTRDGGYIMAGRTGSFSTTYDFWVLKLDANGNVQWQKIYGGTNDDSAYSIQQTRDGGYIVIGETKSFGAGDSDVWVLKLDASGNVQWAKTYGGTGYDEAYSIQQTKDGGYIMAGGTKSFGTGNLDAWVLKLDANGNITDCPVIRTSHATVNTTTATMATTFVTPNNTNAIINNTKVTITILPFTTRQVCNPETSMHPHLHQNKLSDTASTQQWAKTYGRLDSDSASSIQQTKDGGYIVAGWTKSPGTGNFDVWILKLDTSGNVQWQKTYGGTSDDIAFSIQQTRDGGYIVAGVTTSFGAGRSDVWVLKLDANGNVQWQKTYGGASDDGAFSIQQTRDGGYIVAGYTKSFGAGGDVWVLKLDANGNVVWQKTYGGTNDDLASSIQQTSDGGYIVAGGTKSFGAGDSDAWVLKLDANGNVQWQKTYGGTNDDSAYSIQQTRDGGYIVAGGTRSFDAIGSDFWVLKLDANGNVQWQRRYGGTKDDLAYSIQQTEDGGYVVAGGTSSFSAGDDDDFWILKLDANGNVQWQKTYGGTDYNEASSIQQTKDGGYIVAGWTKSPGAGDSDVWVLKLDANGNIAGCPVIRTSYATVNTTTATMATTFVTPNNTNATSNNTKATITTPPFTIKQVCNPETSIHPHLY